MYRLSIPTPCHEDWNAMTSRADGRHCNACEKTVVDLTLMTDDEVQHYLMLRRSERLCVRVTSSQLNRTQIHIPPDIYSRRMSDWKRFLLACLICFSTTIFSCDVNITPFNGEVVSKHQQTSLGLSVDTGENKLDTIKLGEVPPEQVEWDSTAIMGDMQMIPFPSVGHADDSAVEVREIKHSSYAQENFVGGLRIVEVRTVDSINVIRPVIKSSLGDCPDSLMSYE